MISMLSKEGYISETGLEWRFNEARLETLRLLLSWLERPLWLFWRTRWAEDRPGCPWDWCVLCNMSQDPDLPFDEHLPGCIASLENEQRSEEAR